MSITINQQPLGLTPSNAYHIYNASSTLTGQTDFRYVFDVWVNPFQSTAQKIARLKVQPNTSGRGIVNIETILQSYIVGNVRSEYPQVISGSTYSTQTIPTGFIANNYAFSFSNAFNTNPTYEVQPHIVDYRVLVGEQYSVSGVTTLSIPTDPSLPTSTFSNSLTNGIAAYSGSPNTINWSNAGSNARNYSSGVTQGVTYTHTQSGGTLIQSGSTTGTSGSYLASVSPSVGDYFVVTENYSGVYFVFQWGVDATGWTLLNTVYPNNAASIYQPTDITIWPGVQDVNKNWNYYQYLSTTTQNPNGIDNHQYWEAYQFKMTPYTGLTTSIPGRFLQPFGPEQQQTVLPDLISQEPYSANTRYRWYHPDCPLLISAIIGQNQLYNNPISGITIAFASPEEPSGFFGQYLPTSSGVTPLNTSIYQDPKTRIGYWNIHPLYKDQQALYTQPFTDLYVWGYGAGDQFSYTGGGVSEIVRYKIYPDNCLSDPIHFLFLTRSGSWDTYTFDRKNVRKLNQKKDTYAQGGIRNNSIFNPFDNTQRKVIYDNDLTEVVSAQSNWVDPNDTPIIEEVFSSTRVYLIKDYVFDFDVTIPYQPYLIPINILDTNFEEYTGRYGKVFQYTFNFEYNPFQMYRTNL